MTTWLQGTNILTSHSLRSVLVAGTRGGAIYVDFSGKAFENVLGKYRFVHDDGSPPRNIFLGRNVLCN